ncbi:hypothetical protein [Peribacillus sp. NPDC097895]|uniref:hypothetical protein n=1 Tax=Peribacillus sp. NPDC097895 TaxID=3390619 RepID=UPI003CFE0A7A
MGLFKKGNEKEQLQGQQEKLAQQIAEVQNKLAQVQSAKVFADTDLMLEDNATNKKRVDKYAKAIEGFQGELEKLSSNAQEVASQIEAINQAEKQAEIDEAASSIEQETYLAHKRRKMEMKAEQLQSQLYGKSGYGYNTKMNRLAGLGSTDQLDPTNPTHEPFIEASNKASASGVAKAEREFEKLMAEIEKFVEMKL